MRLRRNQLCPIHTLIPVAAGRRLREKSARAKWEYVASTIPSTREGIERSARMRKCGSCWTRRLWPREANAVSAMKSSPTTLTSYPTTSALAAWAERGEMTIRTTFRLSTGGATEKRDRAEADAAIRRFIFYGSDVTRSLRRFLTPSTSSLAEAKLALSKSSGSIPSHFSIVLFGTEAASWIGSSADPSAMF